MLGGALFANILTMLGTRSVHSRLQVNMSGDCHDGGAGVLLPVTSCLKHDSDTSVSSAVQYAHSLLVIVCHYVAFLTKSWSWCWMIYNILELCFDNFSGCCVMIIVGIIT